MKFNTFSNGTLIFLATVFIFACTPKKNKIQTVNGTAITTTQLEDFINSEMDSLGVVGLSLAIINNAELVYTHSFGLANIDSSKKVDNSTLFEAASLSKPFFTFYTMELIDEGVLALDTPLYKYLPYPDIANDERYKKITARMVLSHTTGFPNWRFFYPENKLFIQFEPGTDFFYSGEGYLYLAKVIAHLKGVELAELDANIQNKVCKPLSIEHAWYTRNNYLTQHKATGYIDGKTTEEYWDRTAFNPASSLHTTAQDYSKFLIAVMTKKEVSDEQIAEMLKEQIAVPDDDEFKTDDGYAAWALGFGIKKISDKLYYAHDGENGNFQAHFLFDPTNNNGYVFFSNCNKGYDFNKRFEKFMLR